jgi:hypothetical protein
MRVLSASDTSVHSGPEAAPIRAVNGNKHAANRDTIRVIIIILTRLIR